MYKETPDSSKYQQQSWLRAILARYWRPQQYLLCAAFLLALLLGGTWGTWQNLCAGDACPSVAQVRTFEHEQTSKVYAHDGRQITEFGFERRIPVSILTVPEYVKDAVVAIEDKRFYEHGGFDPLGIARAVYGVVTFQSGTLGGGSTITQQLARNMFDQIGFERRIIHKLIVRKLKEVQVALELERSYTKDQILERYLNEIYMGGGYGFQFASQRYFSKNVIELNIAEAALLAAILNRPGRYDPFRYPERAKERRNLVLQVMENQGYLAQNEVRDWVNSPLPEEEPLRNVPTTAPYFEEWVRQILDDRFGAELYSGGYQIYTTLDIDMQHAAEAAMKVGWAAVEADSVNFFHPRYESFDTIRAFPGQTPYLQGAFIALEPVTGHVKALIGGRDYAQSKFDRARQAQRQAGSSFKPFVYTAAISSGIPASRVLVDGPVVLPQLTGHDWRPANFGQEFEGPMTLREGLY